MIVALRSAAPWALPVVVRALAVRCRVFLLGALFPAFMDASDSSDTVWVFRASWTREACDGSAVAHRGSSAGDCQAPAEPSIGGATGDADRTRTTIPH